MKRYLPFFHQKKFKALLEALFTKYYIQYMIINRHAAHIREMRREHKGNVMVQEVTEENSIFLLDAIGIKI